MDTSKKYIEMCEEAIEIKETWKPELGDFIASAECTLRNKRSDRNVRVVQFYKEEKYIVVSRYYNRCGDEKHKRNTVWLPRQDQLQEMIGEKACATLSQWFYDFIDEMYDVDDKSGDWSMEKMWLAFVMYEKFNKVWDGREWIKINDTTDK